MGSGHWSTAASQALNTTRAAQSQAQTFTTSTVDQLDPALRLPTKPLRECRDSADHPFSTPIIVAFDVTGSMGVIPEYFAKHGLTALMRELLDKKPVPDPEVCVVAVGDGYTDRAPLQVGEFEADLRIDQWLTKMYLEGNGGGQHHESYGLVHWFAARHTAIDSFTKRGKKGILFTIGDEKPHPSLPATQLVANMGVGTEAAVSIEDAIAAASAQWEVFHIVVESSSYPIDMSLGRWKQLLPERTLVLKDYKALPELVLAAIATVAGMDLATATVGFSSTALAHVQQSGLAPVNASGVPAPNGVVTF